MTIEIKKPKRKNYVKLPILRKGMTKNEEIEFLIIIHEAIEDGTYLAEFLSSNMVEWIIDKIKSDFVPDAYSLLFEKRLHYALSGDVEAMKKRFTEKNYNLNEEVRRLKRKVNRLILRNTKGESHDD